MSAVLDQVDTGEDQAALDAAKPAVDVAKPDEKANDKSVPLAALHEAREEARQLKAQIAELEKLPRLSKDDQDLLSELRAQKAGKAAAPPDFLEDPKGYVDAQVKRAAEALQALETGQAEIKQSSEQQRQAAQLMSAVGQQEASFVADTPDYFDALKHTREIRTRQLALIYPDATKEQLATALGQEELAGAVQSLRSKRNPAQVAYEYAKTLGYTPKGDEKGGKAAKVPEADRAAARTLGGSGGGGAGDVDASETEDTMPELNAALRERFGARRR